MEYLVVLLIGVIVGIIVSRILVIKEKSKDNEYLKIVDKIISAEMQETNDEVKKKESGKDTKN